MAIYHCSVKIIGRNSGRSSVAAAAYRAGEKLTNSYDGIEHDFTRKNWIQYKNILLPYQAPKEYADRGTLWNAVEASEKAKNAQLAREFELALPKEMSLEEQIDVVECFSEKLVQQGMIADIVIHSPPVTNDYHQAIDIYGNVTNEKEKMQFINPHAHVMTTMRPIGMDGKWEKKTEILYICKKENSEKAFSAEEFKTAKDEGWQKQYKYRIGKKVAWMTKNEGDEKNLKRINRSPKTEKFGRQNPKIVYWNDKDRILEWRKMWADVVNKKFEEMQSEIRIDHKSFKDQGREDELPTIHMGTAATNLEKRADREIREGKEETEVIRSELGNINRSIKAYNGWIKKIKEKVEVIAGKIINKLIYLCDKLKENDDKRNELEKKQRLLEIKLKKAENKIIQYNKEREEILKANESSEKKIKLWERELQQYSKYEIIKKRKLQKRMKEESNKVIQRNKYLESIQEKYGYINQGDYEIEYSKYQSKKEEIQENEKKLGRVEDAKKLLEQEMEKEIGKFSKEELTDVEEKLPDNIREKLGRNNNKVEKEKKYNRIR